MTKLRLRSKVNFPANVTADGGIAVRKESGKWVVYPKFSDLVSIPAGSVADPATQQVWIYNPSDDSYAVLTLAGLGDALFKLTSTTSNSIGLGSKTFTVQSNKDVGVGQYVVITDDAAPSSNGMYGKVTDYTGTSLTVNVEGIYGSGTKTAWTVRISGTTGATVAGSSSGVRQVYSTTTADADPGAGTFRLNNATPASATAAYLDNLDASGATVSSIFDTWDDSGSTVRGYVRFEKSSDATVWAQFQVTGSVVDGTGYRKLTLANGAGSGAFTNADTFSISFYRTGDPGAIGGSTGATDNAVLRADGAGGATLQNSTVTIDDSGNVAGVAGLSISSGAVFNWNSSDITLTHSADNLTWTGGAGGYVFENGTLFANNTTTFAQLATFRTDAHGAATIGIQGYRGKDSAGNSETYFRFTANCVDDTSGSEDGSCTFDTVVAGTLATRMTLAQGVQVGSPTGGDKGVGTLNATAVYDDNVLLTDLASEFFAGGKIDIAKWDKTVPDRVTPRRVEHVPVMVDTDDDEVSLQRDGGSLVARKTGRKVKKPLKLWTPIYDEAGNGIAAVQEEQFEEVEIPERREVRHHYMARTFKKMLDDGFDPRSPESYIAKMKADGTIPGLPTAAEWEHGKFSIGELMTRQRFASELSMFMLASLCERVAALEAKRK